MPRSADSLCNGSCCVLSSLNFCATSDEHRLETNDEARLASGREKRRKRNRSVALAIANPATGVFSSSRTEQFRHLLDRCHGYSGLIQASGLRSCFRSTLLNGIQCAIGARPIPEQNNVKAQPGWRRTRENFNLASWEPKVRR